MTKYSRPVEIIPEPLNIVMAVDVSGSMWSESLDELSQCQTEQKLYAM